MPFYFSFSFLNLHFSFGQAPILVSGQLLIVLALVCMILLVSSKINENFVTLKPGPVRFNVSTNNLKNKIILKWNTPTQNTAGFIIVFYKNGEGPYVINLPYFKLFPQPNFDHF